MDVLTCDVKIEQLEARIALLERRLAAKEVGERRPPVRPVKTAANEDQPAPR